MLSESFESDRNCSEFSPVDYAWTIVENFRVSRYDYSLSTDRDVTPGVCPVERKRQAQELRREGKKRKKEKKIKGEREKESFGRARYETVRG